MGGFAIGTMALCPDGNPIAVDDIKIGDLLSSDGGRAVKVVKVCKGTDVLFEIKQETNHQLGKKPQEFVHFTCAGT